MNSSNAADFHAVVDQTQQALIAYVQGDTSGMKSLFSRGDDAVLANPLGPARRGWAEVEEGLERAAAFFKGGTCRFEDVSRLATAELGYVFHIERAEAKVGDREEMSRISLRVTMIYRREDDTWKIVHRQADPIMTPRPIESIIET